MVVTFSCNSRRLWTYLQSRGLLTAWRYTPTGTHRWTSSGSQSTWSSDSPRTPTERTGGFNQVYLFCNSTFLLNYWLVDRLYMVLCPSKNMYANTIIVVEGLAKCRPVLVALKYGLWAWRGCLSCHTCCDFGPQFFPPPNYRPSLVAFYDKEGMLLRTYPYLNSHGHLINY